MRTCRRSEVARATWQDVPLHAGPEAQPGPRPRRGARLPRFLQGSPEEHERLLQALGVIVVGTGSVGRRVALHLARLQVGSLSLVDRGRFKPESLLTQPITPAD